MDQDTNEWKAFIMKANQLFRATLHPAAAALPVEGALPPRGCGSISGRLRGIGRWGGRPRS